MRHSLAQQRATNIPIMGSGRRSGSVGDDASVHMDALGRARTLRTESLTAMCLLIIAACALGFMLFFLKAILIPFAIAVFLMYLLQPMVNYLCKPPRRWCDKCSKTRGEVCCEGMLRVTKSRTYSAVSAEELMEFDLQEAPPEGWGCFNKPLIPRWLAVILALGIMLTVLVTLGVIVYGSVLHLQANFEKYEGRPDERSLYLLRHLPTSSKVPKVGAEQMAMKLDVWLKKFNYSLDEDFKPKVIEHLRAQVPRILQLALSALQYSFFVAIFLVYLLISPVKPIKISVWGIIDLHIRRYIRLKTMVGLLAGTVVAAVLYLLGVNIAHVFGIVTFALHFVPNLGPLIATFLPMPLVIFDPDLPTLYQVLAFVLPTLVHLVIGNFVEPSVFGESFELSPVVVLLSLAFWGSLWGIPGMILAVPLIVIARIVCNFLDHPYAKTFKQLLAGNVFEPREDSYVFSTRGTTVCGGVAADPWEGEYREEPLAGEPRGKRSSSPGHVGKDDEEVQKYGAIDP